jgi:hypothetical protein
LGFQFYASKMTLYRRLPIYGVFLWLEREDIAEPMSGKLADIFRKRSPTPEEFDLVNTTLPSRHPLKSLILEEHVSRLVADPDKPSTKAFVEHLRNSHPYLQKYLFKLRYEKDSNFVREVEQRREQSRRYREDGRNGLVENQEPGIIPTVCWRKPGWEAEF